MADASNLDSIAKRAKLAPAKNPYWKSVAGGRGGVSLGYRKPVRGPGGWVVKLVTAGNRIEERLAPADDEGAGPGALAYAAAVSAALAWAKTRVQVLENERSGDGVELPTVMQALEAYAVAHAARIQEPTSYMAGTFRLHVAPFPTFANLSLEKVTSSKIEKWRQAFIASAAEGRGGEALSVRTINSILSQVRAALNDAAEKYRSSLPATLAAEIKYGTKALAGERNARERQIMSDADIRRLVDAAFAVDETGDFGRTALLLAATGARFSQVAQLKVADVQPARSRVMMPGAKKGRRPKDGPPVAIPLGADVIEKLLPILNDRRGSEPLLLHWHHARTKGSAHTGWERVDRRPWASSSAARDEWEATVARAEMPGDTIMMCFRHSSIVRGLTVGLPVRLVAALHDTSVEMIEEHYSAYIVDATEDLARRAVMPLVPAAVSPTRSVSEAAA